MEEKDIIQILYRAIDDLNLQLPPEQRLEKSAETVLFGEGGRLDSLGLVTFIVAAEQKVTEVAGITLTLADEKAMSRRNSPFRTVGTLAEYIGERLAEDGNG
ncbi:MAG TPA: acyl carrier protein [Desulfobulbus sp.]|nr:acyl carrier protein [Desulfobulbus sp.]